MKNDQITITFMITFERLQLVKEIITQLVVY